MRSFHADALCQLPDLAVAEYELLLQISSLELLACFSQWQRQQVLFYERLISARAFVDLVLDLGQENLTTAREQQSPHHVLELAHIVRPRVVAQSVLCGHRETSKLETFRIHQLVHIVVEQLRNIFSILTQRRYLDAEHLQVGNQVTTQTAGLYPTLVVSANSRDNACRKPHRLCAANANEAAILNSAEQQFLAGFIEV